jgi:hypothetical protein
MSMAKTRGGGGGGLQILPREPAASMGVEGAQVVWGRKGAPYISAARTVRFETRIDGGVF